MLTARAVETAKPREKPYKLADGAGLYLYVSPTGAKSWRANYSEAGKQKTRTYGRWPSMSLADARRAHQEAREGPAKPEAAPAPTFREVARLWLVKHLPSLSNPKHRGQVEATLESPAHPGHPLSENTLLFALYRLGYRGRMTVHGFRALASTVLNEQSGFPHDVIERQLAHRETDAVRAAYNRASYLDHRRELMQWWGDWLDRTR